MWSQRCNSHKKPLTFPKQRSRHMPDSLYEYAKRLEKALAEGTRFAAYNKDMRHASVVVCQAIGHAKETVRLLSHMLDRDLYGSDWFKEEARKFLGDAGGKLDILVESDLPADHPVLGLANEFPQKVSMRRVPDDLQESYKYNYMVVDDIGYRFERDREEPQAVVFFNDTDPDNQEFVETLKDNFEAIGKYATPIGTHAAAI